MGLIINMGNQEHNNSREIRVFISSTFSDMREERKYLNTHVFPELRTICEKRGIVFTEVDLQWGISEEDSKQGAAVEICMEEINRCHPYFIGMLGERYGWSPSDDGLTVRQEGEDESDKHILIRNDELKQSVAKWNNEHASVTAMEIMHGVLENKKQQELSFFYLRDKELTQQLFDDASSADLTIKRKDFFEEEGSSKHQKVKELKECICNKDGDWHVYVHKDRGSEYYASIEGLGNQIRDDLLKVINERFPEGGEPSAIDRERNVHAIFSRSRLEAYIPDEEMFRRINEHFAVDNPTPLVITGEMGSGKSALVANYVARWRKANPEGFVIEHYAGSGGESDTDGVLLRVISEIKDRYEIEDDFPKTTDEIYIKFAKWMLRIPQSIKFLIALDGVNQFRCKDGELNRFIHAFPVHGHVLMAMLPCEALDAATQRKWVIEKVEPLNEADRRRLADDYLERFKKKGGLGNLLDKLINHKNASNPLFLRVILDELRLDANHDTLERMLYDYLNSRDQVELFEKVIKRCERDYSKSDVKEVLTLIYTARYGLSEREILSICHEGVAPIHLSSLIYGMGGYLADREGLYGFMHNALSQAVEREYITDTSSHEAQLLIRDYFKKEYYGAKNEKGRVTQRQLDELPWHWSMLLANGGESPNKLQGYLADLSVVEAFSEREQWEIEMFGYWNGAQCSVEVMLKSLVDQVANKHIDKKSKLTFVLGQFSSFVGSYEFAETLYLQALQIDRELYACEPIVLANTLNNLSIVFASRGKYEEAERSIRDALKITSEVHGCKDKSVATSLNVLGGILQAQDKLLEAKYYILKSLELRRELFKGNHPDVVTSLNNLAGVLLLMRDYKEAAKFACESLEMAREVYIGESLPEASTLTILGTILNVQREHVDAAALLSKSVEIRHDLLGSKHPDLAESLGLLGNSLEDQCNLIEAESCYRKALSIWRDRSRDKHPDMDTCLARLVRVLVSQADGASSQSKYDDAENLLRESLDLQRELYGVEHADIDTAIILEKLAVVVQAQKEHIEAVTLFHAVLDIRRVLFGYEQPDKTVADSLSNLANAYIFQGEYYNAEVLYKESLDMYIELQGDDGPDVLPSVGSLAFVLEKLGKDAEILLLEQKFSVRFERPS